MLTRTTTNTKRWLRVGMGLGWLMIFGGLIGVLSARTSAASPNVSIVVAVIGSLLNARLLRLSWQYDRANDLTPRPGDAGRAK